MKAITLHIEKLPEGPYLATSPEISGLVVEEDTFGDTVETACEVAQRLIELEAELEQGTHPSQGTQPSAQTVSLETPIDIPLKLVSING